VTYVRFQETIGGREYAIDVSLAGPRWRAQIRRVPGFPTALMPFYGETPEEAADKLTRWLKLAYQAASFSPSSSSDERQKVDASPSSRLD
jgi:hypothetical protein